jgi:hypothetical protein
MRSEANEYSRGNDEVAVQSLWAGQTGFSEIIMILVIETYSIVLYSFLSEK